MRSNIKHIQKSEVGGTCNQYVETCLQRSFAISNIQNSAGE